MTDLTDALKQAQKYASGERRLARWRDAYIETINTRHGEKLRALRAELSPEAAAIVVAAEGARAKQGAPLVGPAIDAAFDAAGIPPFDLASNGDGEPALSPRLLENPPDAARPIVGEAESRGRVRK